MSKALPDDRKPSTQGQDNSPFKAFLRARWAGLLISAIFGYLFVKYLGVTTLPAWVLNHRVLPDWAVNHTLPTWYVWAIRFLVGLARDYSEVTWVPLAACFFGVGVLVDRASEWLFENNYKTLLIGRYLRRRRIAWVSLIAVMLCTMMVLVVISVMGGWLKMFKNSFRGLSGDIVIHSDSLKGFAYYDQIIKAIKDDPSCQVQAAVPTLETGGLFSFGRSPTFTRVMGMHIEEIEQVNRFDESLYLQHTSIEERLNDENLPAATREKLTQKLHQPPSFDLLKNVEYPKVKGKYNGMIVGTGVIGIRRNRDGQWMRPGPIEYKTPITLTLLDLSSGPVTEKSPVILHFFIVDDSHLGVWQYDQNYVYISFDTLQKALGMDAQQVTVDDKPAVKPARATDIHIRVRPGIDPENEVQLGAVRDRIMDVVGDVMSKEEQIQPSLEPAPRVYVDTWQDTQRIWISTVENEKSMLVILFGIISVVAIFLIFCIFYMIVAEKTKDIGIIKSEGATAHGVAVIFVGYGLVIGIVGAGMGLLLSYLILHDINPLHEWLYKAFGIRIWNPEVYMFDKIPNTMSGSDVAVIVPIAVLSSVVGALVPAILAGRKNPVESLRWE